MFTRKIRFYWISNFWFWVRPQMGYQYDGYPIWWNEKLFAGFFISKILGSLREISIRIFLNPLMECQYDDWQTLFCGGFSKLVYFSYWRRKILLFLWIRILFLGSILRSDDNMMIGNSIRVIPRPFKWTFYWKIGWEKYLDWNFVIGFLILVYLGLFNPLTRFQYDRGNHSIAFDLWGNFEK